MLAQLYKYKDNYARDIIRKMIKYKQNENKVEMELVFVGNGT